MTEVFTPDAVSFNGRMLVGHGFHPGEPGTRQFYDGLHGAHADVIDHAILSPREWALSERLVDGENLSNVMPDPAGTRAQRIMARYSERVKAYDIAIHPHGTSVLRSEMAIYGPNASPLIKGVVAWLGVSRAIVRTRGIESIQHNTVSLEMGGNGSFLSPDVVQEKLLHLAEGVPLVQKPVEEYAYIADVSADTARRCGLRRRYETFEPLTHHDADTLKQLLGLGALELFASCWDAELFDDRMGFRGELLGHFPLPPNVAFRDWV